MPLNTVDYNIAVGLWNEGKTLQEIANALKVGVYDLHPLSRAAVREIRCMIDRGDDMDKPVVLTPLEEINR